MEKTAPAPALTRDAIEAAVELSDDFEQHREAFVTAAESLIRDNSCSLEHFQEYGGWVKSQSHKDSPVYFTYCGGSLVRNRIYVDVSTGEIFR